MTLHADPERIIWRLHLKSPPEVVFAAIDSEEGRVRFWAESAVETEGTIRFEFINGVSWTGRVLRRERPQRWAVEYFGSEAEFKLSEDGAGGTDLTLVDRGVAATDRLEVTAGWLNVLLPLKAYVDFGIDLRNHDPSRTWNEGYVDG